MRLFEEVEYYLALADAEIYWGYRVKEIFNLDLESVCDVSLENELRHAEKVKHLRDVLFEKNKIIQKETQKTSIGVIGLAGVTKLHALSLVVSASLLVPLISFVLYMPMYFINSDRLDLIIVKLDHDTPYVINRDMLITKTSASKIMESVAAPKSPKIFSN